jgi:hypothetical protein
VIGALFGRRSIGTATTAVRGMARAAREGGDVARAEERVEDLQRQLADLEAEFEREIELLGSELDPATTEIEEYLVQPRKSDIDIEQVALVWTPWKVDDAGSAEPLF